MLNPDSKISKYLNVKTLLVIFTFGLAVLGTKLPDYYQYLLSAKGLRCVQNEETIAAIFKSNLFGIYRQEELFQNEDGSLSNSEGAQFLNAEQLKNGGELSDETTQTKITIVRTANGHFACVQNSGQAFPN